MGDLNILSVNPGFWARTREPDCDSRINVGTDDRDQHFPNVMSFGKWLADIREPA